MKNSEVKLNIYPTKANCRIIFFKKEGRKIEILSDIETKISLNNRIFIEKNLRDNYIKELSNIVINECLKYGKCKSVFVNLQESDIILKNINIDPAIKKKDIIKAANIEIQEYCNRTLKEYCIDYKIVYHGDEDTKVQVTLFPKRYVDLFSEVCDKIGIDNRAMHTNFNLLERVIKIIGGKIMKKIDYSIINNGKELGIIEFRQNDLVISVYAEKRVKDSYVIKKEDFTDEIAESIFSNCIGIFCVGNTNADDIIIQQRLCNICEVDFEEDVEFVKDHEPVSAKEFFQIAGKEIN